VRGLSEELTSKCGKCKRIWPAHQLAKDGCTGCKASTLQRQASPKKKKGAKINLQQTLGLVMQSALPEEIEKICHHNLISHSTLTLPHIQRCLEDMMQEMCITATDAPTSGVPPIPIPLWFTAPELGNPPIENKHDRPLHPLVGPFLREYLSRREDIDDALLQTKSENDLQDMRSDGVEPIFWAGTESGLMDIYNFPGVIYATDGSKGSTGMRAGF